MLPIKDTRQMYVSLKRQGAVRRISADGVSFQVHESVWLRLEKLYRPRGKGFVDAVFTLCLRYHAVAGPGFQAGTVLELESNTVEMFASPFNCSGLVYGSRYPDTDGVFGSIGDAFQWFPSPEHFEYEANPPFVLSALDRTVNLLINAKGPFKVTLLIPKWENHPFYALLKRSFPDAKVEALDNRWIQPPLIDRGKASHLRVIPTETQVWRIEKQMQK